MLYKHFEIQINLKNKMNKIYKFYYNNKKLIIKKIELLKMKIKYQDIKKLKRKEKERKICKIEEII